MKSLKYFLPVLIPVVLVLTCFIPCRTDTQNQLLNVVSAIGTIGALLFLIFDKKENENEEKQKFWHEHLPYLTIGSPCDPTQNRCEINLLTNNDSYSNRGSLLFSIPNFSSANAYNVTIDLSTTQDFKNNQIRSHYIDIIPVTQYSSQSDSYNNIHFLYSKYHINPSTKEVLLDEFDLCNFTSNCDTKRGLKTIFIRLQYFSTPLLSISKKTTSVFKIDLECGEDSGQRIIFINNILRHSYETVL